jgi:berberine-like enzyme
LHEVGPMVNLGLFFWGLDRGAEVLRFSRDYVPTLPESSGTLIAALSAPPAPFVPEQYHFAPGYAVIVAGFGSAEDHARLVAPIREALPPLFELVTPMPYTQLQQMLDAAAPWGILAYEKALYLDELTDDVIDVVVEHTPRKRSPLSFIPIFDMGGAYSRVGEDDTAFGGSRTARYCFNIAALAQTPELLEADTAWVRAYWEALRPYSSNAGGYVNFMSEYQEDRVRAAYGPRKYDRLAEIKARYDRDNVFRLNANIRPAVRV